MMALAAGLMTSACNNEVSGNKEMYLAEVDSLVTVVEFLSKKVAEPNEQRIAQEAPEVKKTYLTIVELYPNAEDKDFWIKEVNPIHQVNEAFEKFLQDKARIEKDLAASKEQLQGLRNSINDNKLEDSLVEKYLQQETAALAETHLLVTKRIPKAQAAIVIWDSTRAHYDSLAQALQKQ